MAWAPPMTGARKQQTIARVIREGAEKGWTESYLVRQLAKLMPLDERRRTALTTYRRSLKDVPQARRERLVDAYARKLRMDRAATIARTENAKAQTEANHGVWQGENITVTREWVAKPDACVICKAMHGQSRSGTQMWGDVIGPPIHPNCRCEERVTQAMSKHRPGMHDQKDHGRKGLKKWKTALGTLTAIPDDHYQLTRGMTTEDARVAGQLSNPRSSISTAVNPITGHRMSNTEFGDTMEVLINNELGNDPAFVKVMGKGLHNIVGPNGPDKSRDRRGPIDVETDTFAIEVKALSMASSDPKVSIKPEEVLAKAAAVRELKKAGAILVPLYDSKSSKIKVFAYMGNPEFIPTIDSGRIQIKRNKSGWQALSEGNMIEVGEIDYTVTSWVRAQYEAGWLRDKNGNLPSSTAARRSDEENTIEEGDFVVGIAGNLEPFAAWAGEPDPSLTGE